MSLSESILKIALLGTERQTQALVADPEFSALQPLLQQLYPQQTLPASPQREAAFLSAAAVWTQYQAAGVLPERFTGQLPQAAPLKAQPLIPVAAEAHLRLLLSDYHWRTWLVPWLKQVATLGYVVPAYFIPALLPLAVKHKDLRETVMQVIGERGRWLAQQHVAWQALQQPSVSVEILEASVWEEGNTPQRVVYLQQLRLRDAGQALHLLQTVWNQEAATERQALLEALRVGLNPSDEAWLEVCLDDRSKAVRQLAAELLGGLPNSAFVQRHLKRLQIWLTLTVKSGLFSQFSGRRELQLHVPEQWQKAWWRDGIDEKPPQGKGEKAWWLEQALSFIPPQYWPEQWSMSAAEVLALLQASAWRDALLAGLRQALLRYPDPAWAKLWLTQIEADTPALWPLLPAHEAEQLAADLAKRRSPVSGLALLMCLEHDWSQAYSWQVLLILQAFIKTATPNYEMNEVFRTLQARLAPSSLSEFQGLFKNSLQDSSQAWHRLLSELEAALMQRMELSIALTQAPRF